MDLLGLICDKISYLSLHIINTVRICGRVCAETKYMAGTMETHITNEDSSYGDKQSFLDSFGYVIGVVM